MSEHGSQVSRQGQGGGRQKRPWDQLQNRAKRNVTLDVVKRLKVVAEERGTEPQKIAANIIKRSDSLINELE